MLRIQFDGLTIELGRDRSAPVTNLLHAAIPYLFNLLRNHGISLESFMDDPPPSAREPGPN